MKKSFVNEFAVSGYLFEHDLKESTVKNKESKNFGKPFISGKLSIAIDDACMEVIPVHFTYVAQGSKSYNTLKKILDGNLLTVATDGIEKAAKVRVIGNLDRNEFCDANNNFELVTNPRNSAGFLNTISTLEDPKSSHNFAADYVITGAVRTDADPERNIQKPFVTLKGAIFTYQKELLPFEFKVYNEAGMNYFESLEPSPTTPVFTNVWGQIVNQSESKTITKESAFGEATVQEVKRFVREWVVTGVSPEPYTWNDESTLTTAELTEAMQKREVHLATLRSEAEKRVSTSNTNGVVAKTGGFDF